MLQDRISGILLPIAALPAKDIGTLGKVAEDFLDQLNEAGQTIWQMLPIGPTIIHDSPFYSPSAFAISPNYIDLQDLVSNPHRNVLTKEDLETYYKKFDSENPNKINYGMVYDQKIPLLRQAYFRFMNKTQGKEAAFQNFLKKQAFWLEDYAKFMGLKEVHFGKPKQETWFDWDFEFKNKTFFDKRFQEFEKIRAKNAGIQDIGAWNFTEFSGWTADQLKLYAQIADHAQFHRFLQWVVWEQWDALKQKARAKKIILIGDCPIYVAPDSADVWANQGVFKLDDQGRQLCYAGVPPDYFSPKYGQFWGNPIYRWFADPEEKVLNPAALAWWANRLGHQLSLFDEVRIDHFRGFAGYWEVPRDRCTTKDETGMEIKTSQHGKWIPAPGLRLFEYIAQHLGKKLSEIPVIAEDLGVITADVTALREAIHAPGMGIFQFAPWHEAYYQAKGKKILFAELPEAERKLMSKESWDNLYYDEGKGLVPFRKHEFLPENAARSGKRVFYPGTHDNETLVGWFTAPERLPIERELFEKYMDLQLGFPKEKAPIHWKVIEVLWKAQEVGYAIAQMQDILGLPNVDPKTTIKIRTNIPNKQQQWLWKLGGEHQFSPEIRQKLKAITQAAKRIRK